MKHIYSLALLCMVCTNAFPQRLIDLKTGRLAEMKESTVPCRDIVEDEDGYTVTYTFTDAILQDDGLFPGTVFWKMGGFGLNDIPGEASYLLRNDLFVVPNDCTPLVELGECTYTDFSYELTPARQPLLGNDKKGYTKETVQPIKPYEGMQPRSVATLTGTPQYRGQKLCTATVCPVQYDHARKTVRAYTSITYKVRFVRDTAMHPEGSAVPVPKISPTDNFLRNVAIGGERFGACYSLPLDTTNLSPTIGTEIPALVDTRDYLILSCPKYREAVERFADWKRLMGFNVHTVLRNDWTPALIKSTVREKYDECWRLYHLLIVGDHEDVPGEAKSDLYDSYKTDFYYGFVDDDYLRFPDIQRGRLSVSNAEEANIVVNKIIFYESAPSGDSFFYQKGVNCAFFEDGDDTNQADGYEDNRSVETSEEIRNHLSIIGKNIQRIYYADSSVNPTNWNNDRYSFGGAIPSDLRRPGFSWQTNSFSISNAVNNGCFYLLYNGHGSESCWFHPYISAESISRLTNSNRLPVVFSMSCRGGKFELDCLAESFLRNSSGGGVGVFAASSDAYVGYTESLEAGMFDAIWPSTTLRFRFPNSSHQPTPFDHPVFALGEILDLGLSRMEETCRYIGELFAVAKIRYMKERFHCFGDPSMQIHTEMPECFHNIEINRTDTCISVSLPQGLIAKITFCNPATHEVTACVGNRVEHVTDCPYDLTICVSNHNYVPHIDRGNVIYIQNQTIYGTHTYTADKIAVGSNVTLQQTEGDVVFSGVDVTMRAKQVKFDRGTRINRGQTLRVINNHP